MTEENDAIIAEADEIAREVGAILANKRSAALYLALGEILGALEVASTKPNRQVMFRLIGVGIDQYIVAHLDPATAHKLIGEARLEYASSVDVRKCEMSPAVHINLFDKGGECFATASLPVANTKAFIDDIQAAVTEIAGRHSAPSRRQ